MDKTELREKKAEPIPCRNVCLHYRKCKPFVNPVLCTKLELKPNILALFDQYVGEIRTPRTDLENELADAEFAKLYRDARVKTSRELQIAEYAVKKEREGIFKELDDNSATYRLPYRDGGETIRTIPEDTYQALKDKE